MKLTVKSTEYKAVDDSKVDGEMCVCVRAFVNVLHVYVCIRICECATCVCVRAFVNVLHVCACICECATCV